MTPGPTPLPTAVPPDPELVAGGNWMVAFEHEFSPSLWAAGEHRWAFNIDCPAAGFGNQSTRWFSLLVSEEVAVLEGPVYLRISGGISRDPIGAASIQVIHPEQRVIAVVTFVGLSPAVANNIEMLGCEVLVSVDNDEPISLVAQAPYHP